MTRIAITIRGDADRERVGEVLRSAASIGMRVEIKEAKRSLEQNDLMWARLTDVAEQVIWHGKKHNPKDWKDIFTAGLRRSHVVPNIDGDGFVQLGLHTSDLTKDEMGNLLDLMDAFAANHGVKFSDPKEQDSSDGSQAADRTDAPAANVPAAAGATNHEEASTLSDDWREVYVIHMAGPASRALAIRSRDHQALQMIGGKPNEAERQWMRWVATLTNRRDKGKLAPGEFEAELEKLKTLPLGAAMEAA
jgi:hypothetical protein